MILLLHVERLNEQIVNGDALYCLFNFNLNMTLA